MLETFNLKELVITALVVYMVIMALWFRSSAVREGPRDEYRGWRKFKKSTGIWPLWSIVNTFVSIPIAFIGAMYFFVSAMNTGRLPLIYVVLLVDVICFVTLWYFLRLASANLDIKRAQRTDSRPADVRALPRFLK